jgi:hypothetical protein
MCYKNYKQIKYDTISAKANIITLRTIRWSSGAVYFRLQEIENIY